MWIPCACAALCAGLVAGCGRGSSVSSISIPAAKGRPKLPARDAVVLAREDGALALALAARPSGTGIDLTTTILAPDNEGKNGLDVALSLGNATRPGRPCGTGCYSAQVPASGSRAVRVRVGARTVEFLLPVRWPAPDATRLVRRATAVFRRLHSVRYREQLASSPQRRISTMWTQVAPDRLQYAIKGGADGIIIGATRWDRTRRAGQWVKSPTQQIAAPTPIWLSGATNAHLLAQSKNGYLVSFLNRSIPAWFTIRFDRRLLPRSLDMTAAAHFMHHDYLSFDKPLKIEPPR